MSEIVVVGGGLAGAASAARLAKLGHSVTLLEAAPQLGGGLAPVSADGFTWDAGATSTLLPAVLRDLFRKSGRPLENELGGELEPLPVIREHRFEDLTSVQLTGGSRASQLENFNQLGDGLGEKWLAYVDTFAPIWETLRTNYFENPWDPNALPKDVKVLFDSRDSLHKHLRRVFRDERLAQVAAYPFYSGGHELRNVPVWAGLTAYLELTFGAWRFPGGMHQLVSLLAARLEQRGVRVLLDNPALDLILREGKVAAVKTTMGEVAADAVVVAIDPRRLPTLASYVDRTMPSIPPVIAYVGLEGEVPELGAETVLHGDPLLSVKPGGIAPEGCTAWTIQGRGRLAEDLLRAISRHGLDVRNNVVTRIDRSPRELVELWGGSPEGVLWQGRGTVRNRLGPKTPIPGVYAAGAHSAPGSLIPFTGLSAALVAAEIGPA